MIIRWGLRQTALSINCKPNLHSGSSLKLILPRYKLVWRVALRWPQHWHCHQQQYKNSSPYPYWGTKKKYFISWMQSLQQIFKILTKKILLRKCCYSKRSASYSLFWLGRLTINNYCSFSVSAARRFSRYGSKLFTCHILFGLPWINRARHKHWFLFCVRT